jgi:predicted molibdopterin-dependent oxidoreductase YjgC
MASLVINGRKIEAEEGVSVLQAARACGIDIPALCFHDALTPAGSCRLCVVETQPAGGEPALMLSCVVKVRDGLVIETETPAVLTARRKAFEELLRQAPGAARLHRLAQRYGCGVPAAETSRGDDCVRCGLCVRACKERIGAAVLRFVREGEARFVRAREDAVCLGCGTCAAICPTGAIRIEDRAGKRRVFLGDIAVGERTLECCSLCGESLAPKMYMEVIATRMGREPALRLHRVCAECARAGAAEALSGLPPTGRLTPEAE